MEEVDVGARRLVLRTAGENQHVVVSVTDRGVGVPEDRLGHIFEPFYTTKSEGMGPGLPICRAIIASHGGELRAERNNDGGMTFSFSLPRSSSPDGAAGEAPWTGA
jgi:C4-dicarboxylate-specific signal transduction histidine kinase